MKKWIKTNTLKAKIKNLLYSLIYLYICKISIRISMRVIESNLWCQGGDLNSRPPAYETSALTS